MEKKEPSCIFGKNINCIVTMKNSMEFHKKKKKKKKELPYDPAIASGYFSEENKNTNSKRCMYSYVHCSIFYNIQGTEAT